MKPTLDNETNPEVLRMMAKWLHGHVERLEGEVKNLREKVAEKEKQEQLKLAIADQLLAFRKIIFGASSEKRPGHRPRGSDDEQLLLHSQALLPPPKEKDVKDLPSDITEYEFTAEELKAESVAREIDNPSSEQWEEIPGFYDESTEVSVIERRYCLKKIRRKKCRLKKEFNTSEKEIIITAPGPEKLAIGSRYSIDFAISVVTDKYVSHTPFERQSREMESLGLKRISTKTLYSLSIAVSVHLEQVAARIRNEILNSKLTVHADETPWPIQIGGDNGYMWVISNQAGAYYRFEPTRSGKIIEEMLQGYTGPVLTDGYTGYNRLEKINIALAHCWAHARRKFIEIEENYPQDTEKVLNKMGELFAVEREAKNFEELEKLRLEKSKPIIDSIRNLLLELLQDARGESGLKKAINYTLKYWPGLTIFLKDVRVPLTNNEAERTIRHAVMGRKNSYGSRTINGADTSATLYTIIESCKKVEIDPREYIRMTVRLSAQGKEVPTPMEHARISRAN
jgi:transposase